MHDTPTMNLHVLDLGRLAYAPALAVQHQTHAAVVAGGEPTLILVEHEPVITVSRRKTAMANLLASPERLAALGIEVQPTDRGGDITYHGPGQLVAYPILPLDRLGLSVVSYMRWLEGVLIQTLASHGLQGNRREGMTGVWLESAPDGSRPWHLAGPAKVAALGVRVQKNVTLHGLALNVSTNLAHFQTIVPCGLAGAAVTSMTQCLGENAPTMPAVKATLTQQMRQALAQLPERPPTPA